MNEFELLIEKTISGTRGYISPITENLLWHHASYTYKLEYQDFKTILEGKILAYDETLKCSNCGSVQPAVNRICDSCSFRYPKDENSLLDIDNLIGEMEESLAGIKAFPKPTVYSIMKSQTHFLFPILAFYSLILAFLVSRSDSEFFALIFPFALLFAFLSWVSFRFRRKQKINYDIDRRVLLSKYQKNSVLAQRHFGKDDKVRQLLGNYTQIVNQQEKQEKSRPIKTIIGYGVFAALLLLIALALPMKTYSEKDIDESKKLIGNLNEYNGNKLILKPLQTKIIGNFSDFLEVDAAVDTFLIEVNPTYLTRPEVYFRISSTIHLKPKNNPPYLTDDNSRVDVRLEILDENKNPVFGTIHLSAINFCMQYNSGSENIDFTGIYSIQSIAESDYLFSQKSKIESAKYFVVYGNYMHYINSH